MVKNVMLLALLVIAYPNWSTAARAQVPDVVPPSDPVGSFSTAKKRARDKIYDDHRLTLYCDCEFVPVKKPKNRGSGGKIRTRAGSFNPAGCGFKRRKSKSRGKRLEWEHVFPISLIGRERPCWTQGHSKCVTGKKEKFAGRACCKKVDDDFEVAEADLHNLVPSVGELNGDRSDHPYDILAPEVEAEETRTRAARAKHRLYGRCNFEVAAKKPKAAEPKPNIRGDVARVWFYMSRVYKFSLPPKMAEQLIGWHKNDAVGAGGDTWERERDRRIKAIQGNSNPYVHGLEPRLQDFQF